MMSRGFAVLAFVAVLFITSQFTGVHAKSHFILDGKVRSINSPGEGCCGKVLHFFKRLAKRYARTKLRLVADQLCILTEANGKWGCQQSEGSDRQAAMVVVEDQKGVLSSGVLKRSGKQKATDTTLLSIQPGAHVKADCGRWRCTFTHTGVDRVHQLRLSVGSLVKALEDGDKAVIPIQTRCVDLGRGREGPGVGDGRLNSLLGEDNRGLFMEMDMVQEDGVPLYEFKIYNGLLYFTLTGTTANRELDAPAIAVTLERKPLGLKTKLTFVGKGKTLPPGTKALFISGVEGTQLTQHSKTQGAIRSLQGGVLMGTVSLDPQWVVLMRAKAQNVRVPEKQIKAVVFAYHGGKFNGRSVEDAAALIKTFGQPVVLVQTLPEKPGAVIQGTVPLLGQLSDSEIIIQRVACQEEILSHLIQFAKTDGLAPSEVLYEGDDTAVKLTNYAIGTT